jgi:dihydrofolate reductase
MKKKHTGKLAVSAWVTLDGVFDADTMDQWFMPYDSPERGESIRDGVLAADAALIGRTTYEMLAPYWSAKTNNEDGIADKLNTMPKYVVSSTLEKADWNNTTIIKDDVVRRIAELRSGREILIMGSATLVKSLMDADLIDEFRLLVQPVIMGAGKRFFAEDMPMTRLKLAKTKFLPSGVNLVWYRPEKTVQASATGPTPADRR